MKVLELQQGTPAWHAHRASARNASEASAMLGFSDYMTRTELLRMKHTGLAPEIDAATQRRFDEGHAIEAFARPLIEAASGQELYPITATDNDGYLSASLDGLTMCGELLWECKTSNAKLRAAIAAMELPDSHWPQIEQGLMISGAEKCIFTISDGTEAGTLSMDYYPKPARRAQLLAGWEQFDADLAAYVPQEVIPAAVAAPITDLPALNIQIAGNVVASNLAQWKDIVIARIGDISTSLQTDTDFATAESTVKFLDDGEKKIDLVKAQAQAQASDIDSVFRAMDEIKAMMRSKRLELDKLVKARKESIRVEIMQVARKAFDAHMGSLIRRVGNLFGQFPAPDFATAIKGKKTVASLRDACDTELARAKIAASELADKIEINQRALREMAADYPMLMKHEAQLVLKAPDDMAAQVKAWIADHKEAEQKRIEAERAKIRAEEEARAAAKVKAEKEAEHAEFIRLQGLREAEAVRNALAIESEKNIHPEGSASVSVESGTRETPALEQRETLPVLSEKSIADANAIAFVDSLHAVKSDDAGPAIWRNAKQSVVVMLDDLTVAELQAVANFINRKAWRKAA